MLALCPGFRAAILVDGGYPPLPPSPERNVYHTFHFVPHVRLPVLMINGRDDPIIPHEALQVPFYNDLGSEVEKHLIFEGGHGKAAGDIVRETDRWLRGARTRLSLQGEPATDRCEGVVQ